MWEVIDSKGTIHSGTEDEMMHAFAVMTNGDLYSKKEREEYEVDGWEGDLRLIQVHAVER